MTIVRAEIPTLSVPYAFMIGSDTGYIFLRDFTHTSSRELTAAIDKLEKQGMKRLLLDLRGNPGGVLDQAVDVADVFLPKGSKVVYTRGRTPSSAQDYLRAGRRHALRPAARRPRQPGLRLGFGDRRGRDPGPRPRPDRRPAHVGQGPRAERLHAPLRRGARADDGAVLHAVGALDPEGLQRPARVREPGGRGRQRHVAGGRRAAQGGRGLLHRRRARRVCRRRDHAGRHGEERRAGLEAARADPRARPDLQLRRRLDVEASRRDPRLHDDAGGAPGVLRVL